MTFDPNDPRLTAYVLGELDPAERSEFEAMLEDSAEGRQAVEEIRRTIGWLTEQLREEQAHYAPTAESNHRPLTVVSAAVGPPVPALVAAAAVPSRLGRGAAPPGRDRDPWFRSGRSPAKPPRAPQLAMQQPSPNSPTWRRQSVRMRDGPWRSDSRALPDRRVPGCDGTGPRPRDHRGDAGGGSWRSVAVDFEQAR